MATSRNEFYPTELRLYSTTWDTRTPIRCNYADCEAFYNSDVRRGLFDKLAKRQAADNVEMYYILINSWLHLCCDLSADGACGYLVSRINKQGLLLTIKECDEWSDVVIQGLDPDVAPQGFRGAWSDQIACDLYYDLYHCEAQDAQTARLALILQLLRYPKRFSPSGLKGAREAVWKKFIATQDKWKNILEKPVKDYHKWADAFDIPDRIIDIDRNTTSHYNIRENVKHRFILDSIKQIVHEMLGGYKFGGFEEMKHFTTHEHVILHKEASTVYETFTTPAIKLPPGATQDTCSCSFCKAYALEYWTNAYGTNVSARGNLFDIVGGTISPGTVNKNYKTYRMIAPEPVVKQVLCYHECGKMYEVFKKSRYCNMVDLDKKRHGDIIGQGQDRSRQLAMLGSLDNSYDTIDWSAASDSIMKALSYYVAPPEVRRALDLFAVRFRDEDGKVHRLETTATSGNSLTFLWESIVILAITIAALRLGNAPDDIVSRVLVYGDDTIIPHGYAEIVRDIAKLLGLDMNPDKTCYMASYYREACGGEFFKGTDISTLYFPRNLNVSDTARASEFNETPGRTTSIIALANRFAMQESNPRCLGNSLHQFVLSVIRHWYPNLKLGGDVIGDLDLSETRSSVTAENYHLTQPNSKRVMASGIDIHDHATVNEVGRTVQMVVTARVKMRERQWYKIPEKGLKHHGDFFIGDSTISASYLDKHYAYTECYVTGICYDVFETTIEKWDTPYEVRERLVTQMKNAFAKARRVPNKKVLNRDLYASVVMQEPDVLWNATLKKSTPIHPYGVGMNSDGYERKLISFDHVCVTFRTERPYYEKVAPTPNKNSVGSWQVCVTRAKSHTIARNPKDACLCTKLTEAERRSWWELYSYRKFLAEGPEYEDELMRNLHVSRPRMPYDKAYGSTKVNLVNVYERRSIG